MTDTLAHMPRPWPPAFARFLSGVERGFADAVEPLGLRADRRVGLRVGDVAFQPAIAIMPEEPAAFDADYHRDYVGAVFLRLDADKAGQDYVLARRSRAGPHARFAAIVHVSHSWVDLWLPGDDVPTPYPGGTTFAVGEIVVRVDDLYV